MDDHDHPVTTHAVDADAHAHAADHARERGNEHPAIIVALDESDASARGLLDFAIAQGRWRDADGGDDLYLLSVLPPLASAISSPIAPIATSSSVAAVARSWEEQRALDEKAAAHLLRAAARKALARGVPRSHLHAHVLPAGGGASGVAASISEFVRARHGKGTDKGGVALVAVGSRGFGAAKAALMSALGLGSVSDYVLNHSPAPVAIVRPTLTTTHAGTAAAAGAAGAATPSSSSPQPRVVVLALDESPHSAAALAYAAERGLLGGRGSSSSVRVRVVCSAAAVPFPVLDETAAAAALESRSWQEASEQAEAYALEVAERHARQAKKLILGGQPGELVTTGPPAAAAAAEEAQAEGGQGLDITAVALKSGGGGPADAGAAVAAYAAAENASLVIVGSRGMSAFRAAMAGLVGLGSVSLSLAHHAPCPVLVVKGAAAAAAAPAGAPAAAAAASGGGASKAGEGKQD